MPEEFWPQLIIARPDGVLEFLFPKMVDHSVIAVALGAHVPDNVSYGVRHWNVGDITSGRTFRIMWDDKIAQVYSVDLGGRIHPSPHCLPNEIGNDLIQKFGPSLEMAMPEIFGPIAILTLMP